MRSFLLASLALALGCGGDSSPSGDDGGGPADGAADSSPTSGDGGGGAGGGGTALYPIQLGYQWTFSVAAVGSGSICSPGTYSIQVVSANAVGGRSAFQLSSYCTGISGTTDYSLPGGDEVDIYYGGSWAALVDPTLVEGHGWPYFNTSYAWHRETSVTVPAGTFTDCWTAQQQVTYTAFLTYCRGAGLVRSYSKDLNGSGWDAQLVSKNF
jgi:hypothetical protein